MANNESSFTESIIMSNVEAESTPTTTRVRELSMDDIFNLMKTMSDNMNSNFNEVNSNISEINKCFDNANENFKSKFNELNAKQMKGLKNNVNEINKRFENTNRCV